MAEFTRILLGGFLIGLGTAGLLATGIFALVSTNRRTPV
jgi:hypothetical protein